MRINGFPTQKIWYRHCRAGRSLLLSVHATASRACRLMWLLNLKKTKLSKQGKLPSTQSMRGHHYLKLEVQTPVNWRKGGIDRTSRDPIRATIRSPGALAAWQPTPGVPPASRCGSLAIFCSGVKEGVPFNQASLVAYLSACCCW